MSETMRLADGFDVPDLAMWRSAVERVLRGGDPSSLVSTTADGLDIRPLHTRDDLPPTALRARPAGRRGAGNIGALVTRSSVIDANQELIDEAAHGATSLEVRLDRRRSAGEAPDGVCLADAGDMTRLSKDLPPSCPLLIDAGPWAEEIAARIRQPAAVVSDPLGAVATAELSPDDMAIPNGTLQLRADGELYHAAGATEAQELAAVVATAITYLRHAAGTNGTLRQLRLRLAADADIFATIAKHRAVRLLWANVLGHAGMQVPMVLEAITAGRMMTLLDPYVNMLRTTAAAYAAGIGGAETIVVRPFDQALRQPQPFSRRIARNIQHVLIEESNLHRVADPAGGSFFVEHLTHELATAAWRLVQRIEGEGGMRQALEKGTLQAAIEQARDARLERIAAGDETITGVTAFRADTEAAAPADEADPPQPFERHPSAGSRMIARPLRPHRLAETFESDDEPGARR